MAFSEDELARIQGLLDPWCDERVPIMVRDKVVLQYRVTRHDIVLFELRPVFDAPDRWVEEPIAKFRFNRRRGHWVLLWQHRYGKWRQYSRIPPVPDLMPLLDVVDRNPMGLFWG